MFSIKKYKILLLFSLSLFASNNLSHGKSYITDNDGIIRMNINIIGHVKSPGSYMAYDNIDILSAISLAGGYLEGSNLNNIFLHRQDGTSQEINLKKIIDSGDPIDSFVSLQPNDTVFIKQKTLSRIFLSSTLPAIILSLINVIVTLEK